MAFPGSAEEQVSRKGPQDREARRPHPRTLYEKIWDDHVVSTLPDGTTLLYIDRHLIHEVTSPQAFDALRSAGRRVRRPDLTLAMADHNVPTAPRRGIATEDDVASTIQLETLAANAAEFGIEYIDLSSNARGIVHVVGPEQGFTLPGTTVVCGDSHTASHGALGALAFGIGTSEVEHVLATQTLMLKRSKTLEIRIDGTLGPGVGSKDVALAIVSALGAGGGAGYVAEYTGSVIRDMSIEGRLTICNMSIEAGARSGLVAPDDKAFAYLQGRRRSPEGEVWTAALAHWRALKTDPDAIYDKVVMIDASGIAPLVTWGTSPDDTVPVTGVVPDPALILDPAVKASAERSLDYMALIPGTPIQAIPIDHVFIGSCTNGRIEDLRIAAQLVRGHRVAESIKQALVVPGSSAVKRQAEAEGLDAVFLKAGFEWREPGCSMCLAMNPDKVPPGERCASTSNRNFMGRQGPGSRTHLMSPATAAVTAIRGTIADPRASAS